MALYFVTGALGGGKSLCAMMKIDEYLRRGRKVATNMNLNLEHLCNPDNDYTRVIRVPDAPSVSDLSVIGMGSDTSGDKNHGLLVLDELGTWFNARDFADKGRREVIKFCIHLRKRRWDVLFLVQDFSMVDKQLRGNLTQYLVTCQSSKDLFFLRWLPKFHIATVRLKTRIKVGTWFYRSADLFPAYDTEQLYFTTQHADDDLFVDEDLSEKQQADMALNGLYSLLPPKYLGEEVRAAIRTRHAQKRKHKGRVLVLMMLLAVNAALWPGLIWDMVREPPVTEQEPEVAAVVTKSSPDSFADIYGIWRVQSFVRLGDRTWYSFWEPYSGMQITQEDLEELQITVRSRGPEEALLISPTKEFVSVYR